MAKQTFSAAVNQYVQNSRAAMEAVFKQSVQDLLIEANRPVAQGGKMRVKTSFLRNSLTVGLNEQPSGPSDPKNDPQGNPDMDAAAVIANAVTGDVIWAGWSAEYAKFREYEDGFLESALQNWGKIVRKNAAKAKKMGL